MENTFVHKELPVDPGENKALIDMLVAKMAQRRAELSGDDMVFQFAKYIKGEGHSMLQPIVWQACTPYFASKAKTDLNEMEEVAQKANDDPYRSRKVTTDDIAKYFENITSVREHRLVTKVWPQTRMIQSQPLRENEVNEYAPNGEMAVAIYEWMDDCNIAHYMAHEEILADNLMFLSAITKTCSEGFCGKMPHRGDNEPETLPFPEWCKYETIYKGYISDADLRNIIRKMQEARLLLGQGKTPVMIVSPHTAAEMMVRSESKAMADLFSTALNGNSRMINLFQDVFAPDNKAYALIPQCTVGLFDWGVTTECKYPYHFPGDAKKRKEAEQWGMQESDAFYFRRTYKNAVQIIEPRAFLEITIR